MLKTDYDIPIFKDEDVADLNEYSNEMASALKTQLDKFGNPLVYKGEVATLEDLPSEAESGNIYSVTSENKNYIYNGTIWVEYSSTLDLTYLENNTKTTQTTEVSEELTIENCAGVKGKLDIKSGKTIQEEGTPSSDNIIPIRNVGDNINLFDKSLIGTNYKYNNGLKLNKDNLRTTTIILTKKIKPGKYTVSFKYGSKSTANNFGIQFLNGSETIINVTFTTEKTKTFTINGEVDRLYFYINTSQASGIVLYLDEIKLEEGSTASPYTEYGCGSVDYGINTTQNIFDKDTDIELDGQYRNYGNGNIATNQNYYGIKVKVEGNRKYKVFSYQDYSNLCYFDKDMNYLSGELFGKNTKSTIFNTYSNCEYITLAVAKSGINEFSITEAKTIHFPLSEGQLLHEGDYLAKDGIHQNRKTYTITGNENWMLSTGPINFLGIYLNDVIKDCVTNEYSINVKSNIATGIDYNSRWGGVNLVSCRGNTLTVTLNNVTTIQEAKAYLKSQYENGTPVIVEYELAKEIVTPLTKEQEEAHYELQHLLMYEGYTKIECIDEIKPDIQLTYWYNNELNKSYGERFDKVEENINELEKREIYSTEEQVIGKWIDGKPLYRKVINCGSLPNNTQKIIQHNIENIDFIISCLGYAMTSTGSGVALPSYNGIININLYATTQQIGIITTGDRSSFVKSYVVLEYTKTTD